MPERQTKPPTPARLMPPLRRFTCPELGRWIKREARASGIDGRALSQLDRLAGKLDRARSKADRIAVLDDVAALPRVGVTHRVLLQRFARSACVVARAIEGASDG